MAPATPTWHALPLTRATCSTLPRNRSPASAAIDAHGEAATLATATPGARVAAHRQCLRAGTPSPCAGSEVRSGCRTGPRRLHLRRGHRRPPGGAAPGRWLDPRVTRLCTNGAFNACSKLYGAAWQAARALGYTRLSPTPCPRKVAPACAPPAGGWAARAAGGPGAAPR